MSSDMGSVHRQGVLDTDPSRFGAALDSLSRGDPRDHARLATRLRLPTSGFTEECQRNHSEVHVLVHPNQTNRGNFDPGLFPHFSHHALLWSLIKLQDPSGRDPSAVVHALDDEHLAVLWADHYAGDTDAVTGKVHELTSCFQA